NSGGDLRHWIFGDRRGRRRTWDGREGTSKRMVLIDCGRRTLALAAPARSLAAAPGLQDSSAGGNFSRFLGGSRARFLLFRQAVRVAGGVVMVAVGMALSGVSGRGRSGLCAGVTA